jgi:large subunit ribosomal protein L10
LQKLAFVVGCIYRKDSRRKDKSCPVVDTFRRDAGENCGQKPFFCLKIKDMALQKAKKAEITKEIETAVQGAESVVFVNFHGINVADETALRTDLRTKGVGYRVGRKTLLKRALAGKATGELPELPGEVAMVYAKDATAPAREVYNFQKAHAGLLSILGGIFEGKFQSGAFMQEIATIPSKEVLLSKLAFLFKSPMQRLAIAVNEVAKKK